MYTIQEIYDASKLLYKECYDKVALISKFVSQSMAERGLQYDPKVLTGKFDIILQYSLLQIAVSDSKFDKNELYFIRDLTIQGDFVNYMNSISKSNVTWESMFNSDISLLQRVLGSTEKIIAGLSEEFIEIFAYADAVTTRQDHIAELEKKTGGIIYGLASMDGQITESELDKNIFILKVIAEIKDLKGQIEKKYNF